MTFASSPAPGSLGPLFLTGGAVDRGDEDRRSQGWLDAALEAPATRALLLAGGRTPVLGATLAAPLASEVREELAAAGTLVWLGRLDGVDWVTAAVTEEALAPVAAARGAALAGLREVGAELPLGEAALLTQASAVVHWHRVTRFCARCGAPTEAIDAGWVLRCTAEGTEHFPRTDPAVIVLVTDDEDRVLLGANAAWGGDRYSLFAGFVEPGESLEEAAAREVQEEAGVRLDAPVYAGSQPWPFPASLMLGFTARALGTDSTPDGEEIVSTRWFTRAELAAEVESGRIGIPGGISIAGALLGRWFGGELPQPPAAPAVDPNGGNGAGEGK
ncbi:NAD(+) diphosphatase [Galactobacter valiniphilus]|uniref:NAD(+) diphosphatase n=1 Tax=Galactobacter valiniphilus TaxID=2676122 RepID=A0A399JAN2_9MICC|nr:NAD(+) diphosphatase [Galactobacter valiniphilus]RII42635.1 NAD(+) diphosphatase [Galactobacter valiniphilus]